MSLDDLTRSSTVTRVEEVGNVATDLSAMAADIATMQDDIATIKAQNQVVKDGAAVNLAVAAAGTTASAVLGVAGLCKDILLTIPNWTNAVTLSLQILNTDNIVIYDGSVLVLARSASYSLALADVVNWKDLGLVATDKIVITLSDVPGGTGGTVTAKPRYYGV